MLEDGTEPSFSSLYISKHKLYVSVRLTIDTQLDLAASVAHRTGGSADVNACVFGRGAGDVEVSLRVGLESGAVPGQGLPPLEE